MTNYKYQVGGSLTINAPSYVLRQADSQFYQALKQGEFCCVLNSRQMGKSSLLASTKHRLEQEGFKCSTIDMSIIGTSHITPLQWYKSVVCDLWLGFNLLDKINLKIWWREQEDISLLQRLRWFIEELLCFHFPQKKLVIFIDEVDSILSLDFSVDDFFALIRFCYNQRAINPEYKRITFAIFGVAAPSDFIQDKKHTPFNIGKSIELQGFKLNEALVLTKGLEGKIANTQVLLKEILDWTGGQPFLTQKLCQIVANQEWQYQQIPVNKYQLFIANLVKSYIINNWEFQDEPEHLKTISLRILDDEQTAGRLLGVYQQILAGEEVIIDDSREKFELFLSGLIINSQGKVKIKNKIYQNIFNLEWINKNLELLRPYSQRINIWVASSQQDESQLLKGIRLKEALAWSEKKKLSNLDYRFLAASQELENQEIEISLNAEKIKLEKAQFALAAAKEANHILAEARKTAKLNTIHVRLAKPCIAGFAVGITSFILLLRFIGLLQGIEWNLFDNFLQQRTQAGIEPHIVVITIDEPDLQQIGQYPIPDSILAKAIKNLKTYEPKLIGLDLYRDLPVEPGYQELVELFKNTSNLVGIDKVVGTKVAPPRILAQSGQVGFSDQVLDRDGKVRRALLTVRSSQTLPKGKIRQSLSLQLALQYLKTLGITPHSHPQNRYYIQLGKALLIPLQPFDGGYVRADTGGYQILLNYYGTDRRFQSFSIIDLLQERIPKEKIQNRIVLIGATAESINDLFQTPYNNRLFGSSKQMAGVFIHANIISQLLTAALEGKGIIRTWSETWESLWILFWCGIGALVSWRLKSLGQLVLVIISTGLILILFSYLAFLQAWWIPLFPPLLGLIMAVSILPVFATKQLEKIQLQQTLRLLLAVAKEQPTAGKIAIEYFKQAEGKENQQLIDRILRREN
ncbi:MAG: CHASE2 domain-containing protein [Nostoc sp.]